MVHRSCVVVAMIAICLISVDLAQSPWIGRDLFLQVRSNEPNQTHSVEKLTETFVMNSWRRWNSACWCSRPPCQQSSAATSSKRNAQNRPDHTCRSLHLRSSENAGEVGAARGGTKDGVEVGGGGGYRWVFFHMKCTELNRVVCGLRPPRADVLLADSEMSAFLVRHETPQLHFLFCTFLRCCMGRQRGVFVVSHPGLLQLRSHALCFSCVHHYHMWLAFGYCAC